MTRPSDPSTLLSQTIRAREHVDQRLKEVAEGLSRELSHLSRYILEPSTRTSDTRPEEIPTCTVQSYFSALTLKVEEYNTLCAKRELLSRYIVELGEMEYGGISEVHSAVADTSATYRTEG